MCTTCPTHLIVLPFWSKFTNNKLPRYTISFSFVLLPLSTFGYFPIVHWYVHWSITRVSRKHYFCCHMHSNMRNLLRVSKECSCFHCVAFQSLTTAWMLLCFTWHCCRLMLEFECLSCLLFHKRIIDRSCCCNCSLRPLFLCINPCDSCCCFTVGSYNESFSSICASLRGARIDNHIPQLQNICLFHQFEICFLKCVSFVVYLKSVPSP